MKRIGIAVLVSCLTFVTLADAAAEERDALLKRFVEEFVAITPGEGRFPAAFRQGDDSGPAAEQPAHEVKFNAPFAIAKYEMPQNLYEAVTGENPSRWKGPRNSVEMMSYRDAVKFCQQITALLRERKLIAEDEEIRLPTESEWEYCCRAGTTTPYSFGKETRRKTDPINRHSLLDEYAWSTLNAAGNDPPVGALKPNPWGLYDMHGYLWEFTADGWTENYGNAPKDGRAVPLAEGQMKVVIRSGSWKDKPPELRSSMRKAVGLDDVDDALGFRCVRARVARP